jgi:heptosyltransferase-2
MVAALPPSLRSACTDWSEKLGVSSLNSLFRHIDLVVGIDTGLMHVAASFHIPVFVLFGSNEPWRWYPWDTCHFLLQPSSPTGPQPLLQISADDAKRALADQIVRLLPVP